MAAKTFRAFQPGFRTTDGTKLNNLFQGNEQMQAINVASLTVSGPIVEGATNVTGIGASRASATVVPKGAVNVWATNSTSAQGIALYALASGQGVTVWPLPTIGIKVYTAAGQLINALASTAALTLASAKAAFFYTADGVHIRVQKGA